MTLLWKDINTTQWLSIHSLHENLLDIGDKMLTDERCKQLMDFVGMPNSCSLLEALRQCAAESALLAREEYVELYEEKVKERRCRP